jgi:hypothetical protein
VNPRFIPVTQTSTIVAFTSSTFGAFLEAFDEAERGAAPAGSRTQHEHPGGIGAPLGTTRSPRQELADMREHPFDALIKSAARCWTDAANSMRYR